MSLVQGDNRKAPVAADDIAIKELSSVFHALANPHRLRIFIALASNCRKGQACAMDERACVGDLAAGLALAPSTVSHHLKELRQCGLIHMERRGQQVQCWAEPETLASLERFFATATQDGVTTC